MKVSKGLGSKEKLTISGDIVVLNVYKHDKNLMIIVDGVVKKRRKHSTSRMANH